jgi:hypothetical protein
MDTDEQIQAGREKNPPFKGELTVIWKEEKEALIQRLDAHAKLIEDLSARVKTLEAWAAQVYR